MKKTLILVAGMPGAGKTSFADYLSDKLQFSLICKDTLKEIIWDRVRYDTNERDESLVYGKLAYDLSFQFCKMLMKISQPIIFESNFVKPADEILQVLVQKFGYKVINVLFSGDPEVIHKRFVERDKTNERHPGLVSYVHHDFEVFNKAAQICSNFSYGDFIIDVDATDFSKLSYENLMREILSYIK